MKCVICQLGDGFTKTVKLKVLAKDLATGQQDYAKHPESAVYFLVSVILGHVRKFL